MEDDSSVWTAADSPDGCEKTDGAQLEFGQTCFVFEEKTGITNNGSNSATLTAVYCTLTTGTNAGTNICGPATMLDGAASAGPTYAAKPNFKGADLQSGGLKSWYQLE